MKKLYWIILLVLIFFVGDRLGGTLLHKSIKKSGFRYSRLYQDAAAADILLLGNSRGLIFYQPYIEELTGKKTFNLSYNGLPVDLAASLVGDYYERYPAPELLLIDITMCDRTNDQLLAGFNCYRSFSKSLDSLIFGKTPQSWYAGKLSHLYRYNSEIFQRALYYLDKTDEDWLLDRVITDELVSRVEEEPALEVSTSEELVEDLFKIIQLAERRGTEVKLLVNPYYPPFLKRVTGLKKLKETIEQKTGKMISDYSQVIRDRNGFGDYQHLNKNGSRAFLDIIFKK